MAYKNVINYVDYNLRDIRSDNNPFSSITIYFYSNFR